MWGESEREIETERDRERRKKEVFLPSCSLKTFNQFLDFPHLHLIILIISSFFTCHFHDEIDLKLIFSDTQREREEKVTRQRVAEKGSGRESTPLSPGTGWYPFDVGR